MTDRDRQLLIGMVARYTLRDILEELKRMCDGYGRGSNRWRERAEALSRILILFRLDPERSIRS